MRLLIKLLVPLVVVIVLAVGLLPPLFDKGNLDSETVAAARAASAAIGGASGGSAQGVAEAAAEKSLASHPEVRLISVQIENQPNQLTAVVVVSTSEQIHTFLDRFPGLSSWFTVNSTQTSQLGQ